MEPLAVKFEITDPARFEPLRVVFNALRAVKAADTFTEDHSEWLPFFDEIARAAFRWSTEQEDLEWEQRWFAAPVPQRWSDPTLRRGWSLDAVIEAFRNGEYDLGECERVTEVTGRLTFFEHSYPFGGTGCMRALIESFGHRVTRDWDGETPPPTADEL
jgi:hypothetical protein